MVSRPGSEQAVGGGCLLKPGSFLFRIVVGQPVLVAAQVCTGLTSWSSESRSSPSSHSLLLSSGWTWSPSGSLLEAFPSPRESRPRKAVWVAASWGLALAGRLRVLLANPERSEKCKGLLPGPRPSPHMSWSRPLEGGL